MILSPVTPIGYFISKCDFYHENVFEKLLIITLLSKKKNKTQYFKKIDVQNHINLIARMRSCCSMFIWKLFWDNHSDLVPFLMLFSFSFSLTSKVSWTLIINHTVKGKVYHYVALFFFFFFLKMSSIFSPLLPFRGIYIHN